MKKIFFIVCLAITALTLAGAQDITRILKNEKVAKELELTDAEVTQLETIWNTSLKKIQLAEAEKNIKAAELKKLLLDEPVKMNEIEKVLRAALEAEYTIRLTHIQQMVQLKQTISKEKWAKLQHLLRVLDEKKEDRDIPPPKHKKDRENK
ncbi:MAG: hypothetical protein JW904_11710 [Spirochaetales bacterium]|nr:hypothetical protein [Spirochaetales bacterium]